MQFQKISYLWFETLSRGKDAQLLQSLSPTRKYKKVPAICASLLKPGKSSCMDQCMSACSIIINFKKIFRVKKFSTISIWKFFCLEQQIAVKIQIPSMDVELKLIYEKNSIEVNSKAYGYTRPKHSKVLDLMVRFIFRLPFILLCFKVLN